MSLRPGSKRLLPWGAGRWLNHVPGRNANNKSAREDYSRAPALGKRCYQSKNLTKTFVLLLNGDGLQSRCNDMQRRPEPTNGTFGCRPRGQPRNT